MRSICFYFQVHQPYRLRPYRFFDIGQDHHYYNDFENSHILRRVAQKSYLPMNELLLKLIKKYGKAFNVSFSLSGSVMEQFETYTPEVLESFKKLAATGNVEFLGETYAHSLSSLKSRDEFKTQVELHSNKIKELFGQTPVSFRNTELIYSDEIGEMVHDMGYKTMLTEGAKHVLGWKSPNYIYCNSRNPKLKVLLKNFTLSDDIAFRFSDHGWPEWPLTTDKFVSWLNDIDEKEEVVNLFMDYETFGEHQWKETGIFDFMGALPGKILDGSNFTFATPSELGKKLQPVSAIHVPFPISWADEERDLTAWVGNDLQNEAFNNLYTLEDQVKNCHDLGILSDWYKLQNSDHFYYMCTKWFSDGDVHKYFNPYSSPYDAFINYMNVLSDFIIRVNKKCPLDKSDNEKFIEKTEELGREIQAAAAKKVKAATAKVKAAYETQKNKSYSFEEIKSMSNAKIRQIAKEVDVENWVYALKDAGDELTGKIIPNLTKKAAREYDKLKDELKVRKADIKKSRDKIGEEISRLFRKK